MHHPVHEAFIFSIYKVHFLAKSLNYHYLVQT